MSDRRLPAPAAAWLDEVQRGLSGIELRQRAEIVDGLRAHILEALDRGDSLDIILARLGSPADVVRQAVGDGAPVDETPDGGRGRAVRRWVQLAALVLAVAAFVVVSLLPGYVSQTFDENGQLISSTTSILLFSMHPVLLATLILAVLFTAIPFLPQVSGRESVTTVAATLMVVLSFVAVIGAANWFVVPAAIASVIAAFLPPSRTRALAIA